jgi:hypothetical protein
MTLIRYFRCDHDDCYDEQTDDLAGWVEDGDSHYCPRHDICGLCGHQRHLHHGTWDPPVVGCKSGYVLDNTKKMAGRTNFDGSPLLGDPELWFGETFVVTKGCGCMEFAE